MYGVSTPSPSQPRSSCSDAVRSLPLRWSPGAKLTKAPPIGLELELVGVVERYPHVRAALHHHALGALPQTAKVVLIDQGPVHVEVDRFAFLFGANGPGKQ